MKSASRVLCSLFWLSLAAGTAHAQSPVYLKVGTSNGERFGAYVSACGDVNGDGVSDFAMGNPTYDLYGTDSGTVRIYSGADGAPIWEFFGSEGEQFGKPVTGADVDGDGFSDVIVGVWRADVNGEDSGQVRVFSGADARLLYTLDGPTEDSFLGRSIAVAGDINQDSYPDVVVGANESVWVYSGVDGEFLDAYHNIPSGAHGDHFGVSVHGGGDINGDGWPDYVVGATGDSHVASHAGSVTAFSGRDHAILWIRHGAESSDDLGSRVAILGDLDGDSKAEFAAGGSDLVGFVVVYSGATGEVLWEWSGDAYPPSVLLGPAGDVDGDGATDVLIGSPGVNEDRGTAQVLSGVDGSLLTFLRGSSAQPGEFGISGASIGDVTGDGRPEIIVGEPGYHFDTGRFFVVDVFRDCDSNGVHDGVELNQGTTADCNGNSVPDVCEIATGASPDCNANGVPDLCDILGGTSPDCDGNDVPDECDMAAALYSDCNANGIPDPCEVPLPVLETSMAVDLISAHQEEYVTLTAPPMPFGDVRVEISGVLAQAGGGTIQITLNGAIVGHFEDAWTPCDPFSDFILVPNVQYIDRVAGGDAVFEFEPNGTWHLCPGSQVTLTVKYPYYEAPDCNGNGTDDVIDVLCGGAADSDANGRLDECELENYCTPAPNSSGQAAVMSWTGSNSVSNNDLTLIASSLPADHTGLFIYSSDQAYTPLGNGFLCLGFQTQGFISRLPAATADATGTMTHALDITSPPTSDSVITAGSTWNFQCWFRDAQPGNFNFSDGLRVLFTP